MAFKSVPVAIGTADTVIYELPATLEAAVVLQIGNTSASARTYTVKFHKQSQNQTYTLVADVAIPASSGLKFPIPLAMEAGDRILASASAAGSITAFATVTTSEASPAAVGFVPKGAYAAGTTYDRNDIATENDVAYLSMQDGNIGHTPASSPSWWMVLVTTTPPVTDAGGITFTGTGTGVEQRTVKQRLLERVSVLDYMTTAERNDVIAGNLTVDVTAAFNDAFAAAKHVVIPDYAYLINGTIQLLDDLILSCDNALLVTTQATITMMTGVGKRGFRIKGDLRFRGTYAAGAAKSTRNPSSQFGLVIDSSYSFNIDNLSFENFRGKGMYVHGTTGTMPVGVYGDRGYIKSIRARNCEIGLQTDDQSAAEYITWTHLDLMGCYVGLQHAAGNHVMQGGTIGFNTIGVKLVVGSVNPLHGIIQGMQINHNTTPIEATNVQNGQDFIGCHIYEGRLVFNGCADINFIGGTMDISGIDIGAGAATPGPIWFKQIHFRNGYTPKTILGAFKHLAFFTDCDGPGAVNWSADGPAYAVGYRAGSDADQVLTSGAQAGLIFPNAMGNVGGWFDTATGVYTFPDAGLYEMWWELLFNCSAGAADASLTASYVSLQTAAAATPTTWANNILCSPTTFGNYKLMFQGKARLRHEKGGKLRLGAVIVGTAPIFDDSTWLSLFGIHRVGN